ncbi:Ohr family peroxiredoxin [Streptomyces sp. ADI93-02]|uniref:Ohr family peroxiredoxin n=1 Tax=Streptomyces sp. ADI93-02 TaxID=1522757 RepID=UPI000F554D24|nr:Ohr family peroxiredoxin [Streptomyces sp. ADI93-02]RPK32222.1 Organic hydroperoxide resistance protein OhrB [Streptomyces sp. ADI93-02]
MTEPVGLSVLSAGKGFADRAFSAIYATAVTVSGGVGGCEEASGRARSRDGLLDLGLRMPAESGGDGQGCRPEQLLAAGFAACFHGALSLVARQAALDPGPIAVEATVSLGRVVQDGGNRLRVDLVVRWPGTAREVAAPLLKKADSVCPYTRMTRDGTPATVTLAR